MQEEVDLKLMQANFVSGRDLSGFRVMGPLFLPSKTAKISLRTMDYSPWGSKNRIWLKKFMQVEVDVKCMQFNFGGHGFSVLEILPLFHLPS